MKSSAALAARRARAGIRSIGGDSPAELRAHVIAGLGGPHRELSPKYFYDDAGAALFDRICELDEYYLTRTEAAIHAANAGGIADGIGPRARLVEFGSGSGEKTRRLLRTLREPAAYVPVDICRPQLLDLAAGVATEHPAVEVVPVWADFLAEFHLPDAHARAARTVALYHGSTIGNLHPPDAERFLRRLAVACGPGGGMLVGVDRAKDRAIVEPAYNDAAGVTAEFNRNVLRRINRECAANFDPDAFEHLAIYDERAGRVEMRLVSQCAQVATIPGGDTTEGPVRFTFRAGEYITTEYSYKYTDPAFERLVCRSGWTVDEKWTDEREWFGVWLLRAAPAPRRAV